VLGADGVRVPLLRPGLRPTGPYVVRFVYLHAGNPFAKRGDMRMTLPRMDIPVGIVEWEVFVPENYSARAVDGNVIDQALAARAAAMVAARSADHEVVGATGAVESGVAGGGVGTGAGVGQGVARAGSGVNETVVVRGDSPAVDKAAARDESYSLARQMPSQKVIDLQRRTAGVLPVRVDVPRAGTSHRFVKPLVVDQETVVSFRYKRR
jgi:hypothetical protein